MCCASMPPLMYSSPTHRLPSLHLSNFCSVPKPRWSIASCNYPFMSSSTKCKRRGRWRSPHAKTHGDQEEEEEEDKDKCERLEVTRSELDWRSFRAKLVSSETQSQLLESSKWAHPIHEVESGCVLVATEKLDGTPSFERSVVLLIRGGGPHHHPFGVIVNRPLQRRVKDMEPSDPQLATTFADCALHYGGPLQSSMFLMTAGKKKNVSRDFGEVMPGLCYGASYSLHKAAQLVRSNVVGVHDVRFFVGYSGWELNQLKEEIESGYWYPAACSPSLIITRNNTLDLWDEILQLMGGHYAQLSRNRKPNEDNP